MPFQAKPGREKSTNLVRSEDLHPPRFSAPERVDAAVTELRWTIRTPYNHKLNVQKHTKEDNFNVFNARFLPFFCGVKTNE